MAAVTMALSRSRGVTAKAKGHLAEGLQIHGRGLVAVEGEIGDPRADHAADQRQDERFRQHGEDDRAGAKTQGPQRGDLAGARGDGAIHRVQRAEQGAEAIITAMKTPIVVMKSLRTVDCSE